MSNLVPVKDSRRAPIVKHEAAQADDDEHLIKLWLHGKSANTQEAYERDVLQFIDFIDRPLQVVRLGDLQSWADHLASEDLAASTQARKLAAVKSLFTFGYRIGYLTFNIGAAVKTPKVEDRLAERILSEPEVQHILASETDLRNSVILRLFYASGGRVSELSGLCWRHVVERNNGPFASGQVTLFGKGGKTRAVLLSAVTWNALAKLRKEEMSQGFGAADDPVFRSRKGGSLSRQQLWRIVKRAARNAGLERAVSPHWFRHAHASHALDRGAPAHLVKETLGHKSLATTSKYTHARPDDSSSNYLSV